MDTTVLSSLTLAVFDIFKINELRTMNISTFFIKQNFDIIFDYTFLKKKITAEPQV